MRITIILVILLGARSAHANWCSTHQSRYDAVAQLEAIADDPKAKLDFPEYARCLPKLRYGGRRGSTTDLPTRAVKACEAILGHTKAHRPCIDFMASRGERTVGSVDIADAVMARGLDPWKLYNGHGGVEGEADETYDHYIRLHLADAAAKVTEAWREGLQRLPKLKKHPNPNQDPVWLWGNWRQVATKVLAHLGGKPELEFLKQQLVIVKRENNGKLAEQIEAAIETIKDRSP